MWCFCVVVSAYIIQTHYWLPETELLWGLQYRNHHMSFSESARTKRKSEKRPENEKPSGIIWPCHGKKSAKIAWTDLSWRSFTLDKPVASSCWFNQLSLNRSLHGILVLAISQVCTSNCYSSMLNLVQKRPQVKKNSSWTMPVENPWLYNNDPWEREWLMANAVTPLNLHNWKALAWQLGGVWTSPEAMFPHDVYLLDLKTPTSIYQPIWRCRFQTQNAVATNHD